MITAVAVSGYRSLRDVVLPLGRLTVITGANGTGKSSLYRALRLLAGAAQGTVVSALAREGGLASTLWAGPEDGTPRGLTTQGTVRRNPVGLRLGFVSEDVSYAIDLGLPQWSSHTMFGSDPEIKAEAVWNGPVLRPSATMVERRAHRVKIRRDDGTWDSSTPDLAPYDSVLLQLADPQRTPEVLVARTLLRSWRFYDQFRTDADSPARRAQVGTRTPVLDDDGAHLAAALQTIQENGDGEGLAVAVDRAFPGSTVQIHAVEGRFEVALRQPGVLRPMRAAELSDGTLRFLLLAAALLSPRPPRLLVLNEPETSLHPDLLSAVAGLVRRAGERTQVVVVTHAAALVEHLSQGVSHRVVELEKGGGATVVPGRGLLDVPPWTWPTR